MNYKAGDRVKIKSLDWYNENKDANNGVRCGNFTFYAAQYCGFTVTIALVNVNAGCYIMKEIDDVWTDEMIEGLVEDETKPNIIEEAKTYWDSIKDAWICPEGYQFKDENDNVINTNKIVLEKKKKEYPKTYEECCEALEYIPHTDDIIGYKWDILQSLQKLLICRDAYWKIAGEEMGLGKSWKLNWEDENQEKHIIGSWLGTIQGLEENFVSHPFAFPTEEMRDAFYENFKELIEICKELL